MKIPISTKYGRVELTEAATEIVIPGLAREYTFVQVTDLHFACHEPGDPAEAVELADARNAFWQNQGGVFACDDAGAETKLMPAEVCELVADRIREISPDGVFFTGDTVDYAAAANFRMAKRYLDSLGADCMIVPGNHDAIGEDATDDTAAAFRDLMGDVPEYFLRELDGFDILGFADGFVRVTDGQVRFLEDRLALGRPVIVLLHAPVYTESARTRVYPFWGYNWMVGDPGNPEGKQTPANFRFRELLTEHRDQVKAVITGHVHMATGDEDCPTADGDVTQYTSAPAFTGYYRVISIHG